MVSVVLLRLLSWSGHPGSFSGSIRFGNAFSKPLRQLATEKTKDLVSHRPRLLLPKEQVCLSLAATRHRVLPWERTLPLPGTSEILYPKLDSAVMSSKSVECAAGVAEKIQSGIQSLKLAHRRTDHSWGIFEGNAKGALLTHVASRANPVLC